MSDATAVQVATESGRSESTPESQPKDEYDHMLEATLKQERAHHGPGARAIREVLIGQLQHEIEDFSLRASLPELAFLIEILRLALSNSTKRDADACVLADAALDYLGVEVACR